jgi:hypothetical protein
LVAHYHLPEDDWMGFTHAYFPEHAFDEIAVRSNWIFGRAGSGYIGITASIPIVLTREGPDAHREIKAPGRRTIWLCQMGREAQDGAFSEFQERVLADAPDVFEDTLTWTTPRGATIESAWRHPLLVNGDVPEAAPNVHIATPYCRADLGAAHTDIIFGDTLLRLDFSD